MDLNNKRILITGGNGLLGRALVDKLYQRDISVFAPTSYQYDYLNEEDVWRMISKIRPQVVFNLFVSFGGIVANEKHPAKIFKDNLIGNMSLIEYAKLFNVEKLVQVGSQCSYGDKLAPPFKEEDIWNGLPTANNAPYGISKRAILMMLQSYRKEYGFNGVYLVPSNMYGPHDNFHPEATHVIPTLIRRFHEAKINNKPEVEIWGTGNATREFLFNEDAAEALILAAEKLEDSEPVNLGTGVETSIRELAETISDLIQYPGKIVYNNNGLDGQSRRCNSIERAKERLGFVAKTDLRTGLKKTIEYFYDNIDNLRQVKIYE